MRGILGHGSYMIMVPRFLDERLEKFMIVVQSLLEVKSP